MASFFLKVSIEVSQLIKIPFIRYVILGGCSAIIEVTLLIILVDLLHVYLFLGNIFAFVSTNLLNYVVSRHWVFEKSGTRRRIEFPVFMLFLLIGLGISQLALWLLIEQALLLDYKVAKVLSIGFVVAWNFFTRKHIVFKKR